MAAPRKRTTPKPPTPAGFEPRKGPGQPRALTETTYKRIVDAMRSGAFLHHAADYAGVSTTAVEKWQRRGRAERDRLERDGWDSDELMDAVEDLEAAVTVAAQAGNDVEHLTAQVAEITAVVDPLELVYVRFVRAIQRARGAAVVRNVTVIQNAATDSWQAAAWYLERTQSRDFGRRDAMAVAADVRTSHEAVSPAALEDRLAALIAARTEGGDE